jgi:hypothetical protein
MPCHQSTIWLYGWHTGALLRGAYRGLNQACLGACCCYGGACMSSVAAVLGQLALLPSSRGGRPLLSLTGYARIPMHVHGGARPCTALLLLLSGDDP